MFYIIVILAGFFAMPANALDGTPAYIAPSFKPAPLDLPPDLMAQASPDGTTSVDPLIGTWKLTLEKSTFTGAAALPKSTTATWAGEGYNLAVTVEGVNAQGKPFKVTRKHIYDGQPHPVTGSLEADKTYTTHIDGALFTNAEGTESKAPVSVSGDELRIGGANGQNVYRRVKR